MAVNYVIMRYKTNPKADGLLTANSISQLNDALLSQLYEMLEKYGIPYTKMNSKTGWMVIGEDKEGNAIGEPHRIKCISCHSTDTIDSARGAEFGYWVGDECAYYPEYAYKVLSGRIRNKHSHRLEIRLISTPKGFNWFYEYGHPNGDFYNDKLTEFIHATSDSNIHLPDGYLEQQTASMTEQEKKQELEGAFVTLSGERAYFGFDDKLHVKELEREGNIPRIGQDFNYQRMASAIGEFREYNGREVLYIFDELVGLKNTFEMIDRVIDSYGKNVIFIPDATSNKNHSNSTASDLTLLRNAFGVDAIQVRRTNPPRLDRIAIVNKAFRDGKIIISPKCKTLIKEMLTLTREEVEVKEGRITDVTVAFGYLVFKYFNFVKDRYDKRKSNITTRIL